MSHTTPYQRILVAIDFDHEPGVIIEKALQIASHGDTSIRLVHCVIPVHEFYTTSYTVGGTWDSAGFLKAHQNAVDQSSDKLDMLARKFDNTDNTLEPKVLEGRVVHQILKEAQCYNADLIIVGSHCKRGMRLLLGSVANGILHHAECDTLIIHLDKSVKSI